MVHTTDVLIVGGGVIGLTAAYRLAAEGLTVTVVDRSRVGTEASWAGAGMLPPGNPHTAGGIEATLRGMSHVEWQGLSQELLDRTGIDNGYRQCGSVQLATTADEAQLLLESWQKQDIPAELLDRHTLHFHVPNAADNLEYGIFVPDFAQVRNPRHLKALKAACCQLNVTFVECVPDIRLTADDGYRMKCSRDEQSVAPRLEPDSGGAAGTMGDMGDPREVSAFTDCGEIKAKNIIVAAGAWSGQLLAQVGVTFPSIPVRGQIAQLSTSSPYLRCVIERGKKYLVPRPDGLVIVGSTEERGTYTKQATLSGISGLLKFAEEIVPCLNAAEVLRTWSGIRPGTPDELPFIGRIPCFSNLLIASGHFRSGLQMSPGTSILLKQSILGS